METCSFVLTWNTIKLCLHCQQQVAGGITFTGCTSTCPSLPSARQHSSYGDYLEVKREYYQNCCVLGYVTRSQSAAHSYEQFLQVQQIGFVTLGPLRHAWRQLPRVVLL